MHRTGTEDLPALWPADGSMGEEGGANGEQPQTQSQGEQDTGVLWEAISWDPQAERAARALPEVIHCDWSISLLFDPPTFCSAYKFTLCLHVQFSRAAIIAHQGHLIGLQFSVQYTRGNWFFDKVYLTLLQLVALCHSACKYWTFKPITSQTKSLKKSSSFSDSSQTASSHLSQMLVSHSITNSKIPVLITVEHAHSTKEIFCLLLRCIHAELYWLSTTLYSCVCPTFKKFDLVWVFLSDWQVYICFETP